MYVCVYPCKKKSVSMCVLNNNKDTYFSCVKNIYKT